MTDMKQSGIEWVGEIPAHWNIHPVYFYFGERKRKNRFGQEENLLSLSYGKIIRKDINTSEGLLPESFNTYNIVEDGDIIIRPTDLQNDKRSLRTGLVKERGIITSAYIGLMPLKKLDSRFFNYQLHAYDVIKVFYNMGNGVRQGLNYSEFSKLLVFEPPLAEQKRIADFLDTKCAEIDGVVADIQSQIDTLEQYKRSVITETVTKGLNPDVEMKDSGIEWVGRIPKHWVIMPNKYIMHKVKEICPVYGGEDILSLTMRGVVVRDLEAGGKMPTSFDGYQRLKRGNLLMCLFDIDVTPRCIGLIKNDGLSSPAYSQFVLHHNATAEYYYYYYLMVDFTKELLHMAKNLRHSLTEEQLGAISTPVPPIQEQKQIADYLDFKCAEIDSIIDQKKEQLTVLEDYKKSLIYEYVTGKKEVPAPMTAVMIDPNVILLGKIPKLLSKQKGKIYNQKVLYLLNTYLGLNLSVQYYRYKHGPYDVMLDSYIETLVKNGWCVKSINNGVENLEAGSNYGAFEEKYSSYFSEYDAEIKKLIKFVQPMKRSQIERVATLFAVWNDMILDGKSAPTDAGIISEVMSGWTENKANFSYDTWLDTLNKMRKQGIVTTGRGLHTLPKPREV